MEILFRFIFWLIEKADKGELPKWTLPALILPVAVGVIVGWLGGDMRAGLILGAVGLILSATILVISVETR